MPEVKLISAVIEEVIDDDLKLSGVTEACLSFIVCESVLCIGG